MPIASSAAGSIVTSMPLFQSQAPVSGPQPLPSSVPSIFSQLPQPEPPSATLPPPQHSTGAHLFQRIQQLQAQQAITLNQAYHPPPPSSSSLFSLSAVSNPYTPPAQVSAFGGLAAFQPSIYDPSSAGPTTATPKEEPDYYPACPAVDEERTLGEFEHFLKLPIEIIGLVVEQCAVQDGVCLSLTSKDLYTLTRPILLRRDKEAYSLSRLSQYECRHFLSKTEGHKPCTLRSCRNSAAFSGRHCVACTSCPLYVRLGDDKWSGLPSKQFSYCPTTLGWNWEWAGDGNVLRQRQRQCRKFKLKKKFWKGKCLHGCPRPKPRKEGQGSLTWTHKRGLGGWQCRGKMWKTLYTENDLHKFQNRYKDERTSKGGYSLRTRPKPTSKRVEHVNLRYGVDLMDPSGRGPVEGTDGWEKEVQQPGKYNPWDTPSSW